MIKNRVTVSSVLQLAWSRIWAQPFCYCRQCDNYNLKWNRQSATCLVWIYLDT